MPPTWIVEAFDEVEHRERGFPLILEAMLDEQLALECCVETLSVAEQRCWLHKMRNVEEKLPKKSQAAVHTALVEIMHAEREPEARRKLEALAKSYERGYPKAAACLRDDVDRLFAYYRFPHACCVHLRTTNPIESIFSPIRNRTDAMKRLRTSRFATAVLLALISKLSTN